MGCGMKGKKKARVAQELLSEETLCNSYYCKKGFGNYRTEKI